MRTRWSSSRARSESVPGEIPDAAHPPSGCRFHPRCPLAEDICRSTVPPLVASDDRYRLACHVRQRELHRHRAGPSGPKPMTELPTTTPAEVLVTLRGLKPTLVPSKRRVADYILRDPARAATETISELARGAETSETTVLRLCQELGVRGYRELRVTLAAESGREQALATAEIGGDIGRDDDLDSIIDNVTFTDQQAIADTARTLDRAALAEAIDLTAGTPDRHRRRRRQRGGRSRPSAEAAPDRADRLRLARHPRGADRRRAARTGGRRDRHLAHRCDVGHRRGDRGGSPARRPTIALTGVPNSPLARKSTCCW